MDSGCSDKVQFLSFRAIGVDVIIFVSGVP